MTLYSLGDLMIDGGLAEDIGVCIKLRLHVFRRDVSEQRVDKRWG